ncbi:hypothetical protein GKZ89_12280 [Bacillus mangrovi]|uniref:Uncharacterized protein n=1 Tax=Metabacillus mangrovi TaxID=1491830 RepID=A0A7X2V5H4_9BACI|nr:hypothetical protein [Metabacillus mangrovi]MTH54179.1 hypothetical protein [Metabacillus mangrovi]
MGMGVLERGGDGGRGCGGGDGAGGGGDRGSSGEGALCKLIMIMDLDFINICRLIGRFWGFIVRFWLDIDVSCRSALLVPVLRMKNGFKTWFLLASDWNKGQLQQVICQNLLLICKKNFLFAKRNLLTYLRKSLIYLRNGFNAHFGWMDSLA